MDSYGHRSLGSAKYVLPVGAMLWENDVAGDAAAPALPQPAAAAMGSAGSGGAAAHDEYGGVDPSEAKRVIALAASSMASSVPANLAAYTATHNVEAVLKQSVEKVAASLSATPFVVMAQSLPAPTVSTPTLPAAADELGMGQLRHTWMVLNAWESGP